jgi:hypothetical protein
LKFFKKYRNYLAKPQPTVARAAEPIVVALAVTVSPWNFRILKNFIQTLFSADIHRERCFAWLLDER